MTTYPLHTLPLPVAKFLAGLEGTLQADIVAIKLLLDQVDRLGHAEGLGDVFAAWDEAYPWMLKFGLE